VRGLSTQTILFYNLANADSDRKGLPFIRAAREMGLKVIVICHTSDTKMLCGDINDVVPIENPERIRELILKHGVDFAMTVNSRLTPIVAGASQGCSISNYSKESAIVLNSKDLCAEVIQSAGLQAPRHWIIKSEADWKDIPAGLPLILKPTFSTGAIDTVRFSSAEDFKNKIEAGGMWCEGLKRKITLDDFYKLNSRGTYFGRFLLQEHIPYRKQIGMELLIVGGKLHLVHSAEILTAPPELICAYAHVGPVPIPSAVLNLVLDKMQNLVTKLQLKNCHLTPDFLIDEKNEWYLIDANLNMGGEGLADAVAARGLNYPLESLKAFVGQPFSLETNQNFSASYAKPVFSSGAEIKIASSKSFDDLNKTIKNWMSE
jgi:biotin carboxylase